VAGGERRQRVDGILGDDQVAEHEAAPRPQRAGDAREQRRLLGAVEVVDGQRRHHEVERPLRQGLLDPADREPRVAARQRGARGGEHLAAVVDPMQARARMRRQHPPRRLAAARAELEDVAHAGDPARVRDLVLEPPVVGLLCAHQLEEAVRTPVELSGGGRGGGGHWCS
jgi:hypothetical protein